METILHKKNERELQLAVQELLSDPSIIRKTYSGKRLQVLSPGRLNHEAGPDFLDMAILLGGEIIVGNAEFHRKSSEWFEHNHNENKLYESLILHIVLDNNSPMKLTHETLVLGEDELIDVVLKSGEAEKTVDAASLEDLQHFALLRLLRKTSEAQRLIKEYDLAHSYERLLEDFFNKFLSRRKRPIYTVEMLAKGLEEVEKSHQYIFLLDLINISAATIPDKLYELLKTKSFGEGSHLRREILMNCVLPIALCLASEESRIALFQWYWSTPSLNYYGKLKRYFPEIPQNYLWQQQGMLEYIRVYGKKSNVISETLRDYGFAQTLSFYRLAGLPLNPLERDELVE